ncbi:unnamed protein product [Phytophthora fragariaefolia]|uniref:Unnamed protein product n=1 Tax=Phytophthora fragariaefolia TaxID=1490495 RepID=A0A9W6XK92_9STRA|nr:unnamed protein product [Phytophthora fragariaefolia]
MLRKKESFVVTTSVNGTLKSILLATICLTEGLQRNLVLVKQLRKSGLNVIFGENCTIRDSTENVVATAVERQDLRCLSGISTGCENLPKSAQVPSKVASTAWSCQLPIHFAHGRQRSGMVSGITLGNRKAEFCMSCSESKL